MVKKFILVLLFAMPSQLSAQEVKKDITKVIETLFEGMYASDTTMISPLFQVNAIMQTIVSSDHSNIVKEGSVAQFLRGVAQSQPKDLDEQFTIEAIYHDDNLAQAWVPYKFYYKGAFSHSGNNHFVLVRQEEGWKIQYIIDTRYK